MSSESEQQQQGDASFKAGDNEYGRLDESNVPPLDRAIQDYVNDQIAAFQAANPNASPQQIEALRASHEQTARLHFANQGVEDRINQLYADKDTTRAASLDAMLQQSDLSPAERSRLEALRDDLRGSAADRAAETKTERDIFAESYPIAQAAEGLIRNLGQASGPDADSAARDAAGVLKVAIRDYLNPTRLERRERESGSAVPGRRLATNSLSVLATRTGRGTRQGDRMVYEQFDVFSDPDAVMHLLDNVQTQIQRNPGSPENSTMAESCLQILIHMQRAEALVPRDQRGYEPLLAQMSRMRSLLESESQG